MRKFSGFLLVAAGALLLAWGIHASESIRSEISKVVEGVPSDQALWLTAGGTILGLLGLGLVATGGRSSR